MTHQEFVDAIMLLADEIRENRKTIEALKGQKDYWFEEWSKANTEMEKFKSQDNEEK